MRAQLLYLDVDWIKLAGRVPDMGSIFYRLAQFDFKYMDLIAAAMWETLSITVLSTLYSVILGLFFGMFAAEIFSVCAGCRYWCSHGLPFCVPCRRRYGCF